MDKNKRLVLAVGLMLVFAFGTTPFLVSAQNSDTGITTEISSTMGDLLKQLHELLRQLSLAIQAKKSQSNIGQGGYGGSFGGSQTVPGLGNQGGQGGQNFGALGGIVDQLGQFFGGGGSLSGGVRGGPGSLGGNGGLAEGQVLQNNFSGTITPLFRCPDSCAPGCAKAGSILFSVKNSLGGGLDGGAGEAFSSSPASVVLAQASGGTIIPLIVEPGTPVNGDLLIGSFFKVAQVIGQYSPVSLSCCKKEGDSCKVQGVGLKVLVIQPSGTAGSLGGSSGSGGSVGGGIGGSSGCGGGFCPAP